MRNSFIAILTIAYLCVYAEDYSPLIGGNAKVGVVGREENMGAKASVGGYFLVGNFDIEMRRWKNVYDESGDRNLEFKGYIGVGVLNIIETQVGFGPYNPSLRLKIERPLYWTDKVPWFWFPYPERKDRPIPLIEIFIETEFPAVIGGLAIGIAF